MIILDEFIDLMKVISIKMVAFYAEMPFDRFGKDLRFVGVGLGDFVRVAQSWVVGQRDYPTLRHAFLILRQDSFELVSRLIELQNFSQLTGDSILNSPITCFCN